MPETRFRQSYRVSQYLLIEVLSRARERTLPLAINHSP
jgi:hypothetical protein